MKIKKRSGNNAVLVAFMLIIAAVMSSFFQSVSEQKRIVENERGGYVKHYNQESVAKIAAINMLGLICSKQVEVPISLMNDSIYAYEDSFEYVQMTSRVQGSAFIESLANPDVVAIFKKDIAQFDIQITVSPLSANYEHTKNILLFQSGDVLYLNDIEITVQFLEGKTTYTNTYTVKNLLCEIEHMEASFQLKFNEKEAMLF